MDEVQRAGQRAAALVRQLLAFSRGQTLEIEVIDLSALVQEISGMLRRVISEEIELRAEGTERPALVRADRSQLEQVVVNLALNARDAMPEGGRIDMTIAEDGADIVLTVGDSGHGMDEETARRAIEPFFTTKDASGTGLGLSTSYGIVTQLGGSMTIESAPGAGTRVRICLAAYVP